MVGSGGLEFLHSNSLRRGLKVVLGFELYQHHQRFPADRFLHRSLTRSSSQAQLKQRHLPIASVLSLHSVWLIQLPPRLFSGLAPVSSLPKVQLITFPS